MSKLTEVLVPDIGDFKNVPVIEVSVAVGDEVTDGDTIIVVESDKATIDIPVSVSGIVSEIKLAENDLVSEGSLILTIDAQDHAPVTAKESSDTVPTIDNSAAQSETPEKTEAGSNTSTPANPEHPTKEKSLPQVATDTAMPAYASPSVRRLARQLGADITLITGSGTKNRILREDVESFVNARMTSTDSLSGAMQITSTLAAIPAWPEIDFEQFGTVERQPLTRIGKIAGPALARNAIVIPHVTHFDKSDITDTEAFRQTLNNEAEPEAQKITLLSFSVLAVVSALKQYPKFNSSLDGDELVIKQYWNIGVAADTADGLVVPVLKNADQKGLKDIAREMAALAKAAREGTLTPSDMRGATFTISSLGGIGGTNFTPIINAPEVAILGIPRSEIQPVWLEDSFQPRRIQPLSLSFDHRVVDGAAAARFLSHIAMVLNDFRRNIL